MPHAAITLVLLLVGLGLLLCGLAVGVMAWSLVHPPRMTDGKAAYVLRRLSPADLGLQFEDICFDVHDANGLPLRIASWWISHPQSEGRCAMLLHGYADAKVGAIAWAPAWHALGFNLLVCDLPAHGESGGAVCTAGYFERNAISQVIDEIRARYPADTQQMVLFGASLGGAVAAAVAAGRSDIAAVVIDSPYPDFPSAAIAHMGRLGAPGHLLARLAVQTASWLTRADYSAVAPVNLIPRLPCPVLLIESGQDHFLSVGQRDLLSHALRSHPPEHGPAELWVAASAEHLLALTADPIAYQQRLSDFLSRALAPVRVPVTQLA